MSAAAVNNVKKPLSNTKKSKRNGIIIRPFKGFRPPSNLMSKVACPPYDVIESDEARVLASNNEYSFLRVNKPEITLSEDIDIYDKEVYKQGRINLENFIKKGWLVQEKEPVLYIYSQRYKNHIQYGIMSEVSAIQYEDNLIKKHELTRKKKEDDRTQLTDIQSANVGPVFLCYKSHDKINKIVKDFVNNNESYSTFTADDNIEHSLWIINDKKITNELVNEFQVHIPCLYVADGHHRAAAAARVYQSRKQKLIEEQGEQQYTGQEDFNYFLAVLFPHDQLKILDYNRIVCNLNNLSSEDFLKKLSENWIYEKMDIKINIEDEKQEEKKDQKYYNEKLETELKKTLKIHEFRMYLYNEGWYKLEPKPKIIEQVNDNVIKKLDVSILTDYLLDPILNIKDLRSDEGIQFAGGIKGFSYLQNKIDENKNGVAFGLYPTQISQLMEVADANKIMPPKSTWFEPKLRSGVVVRLFG